MKIPKKYQQFLEQGAEVEINKKARTIRFIFEDNYDLVKRFLLMLDVTDFEPYTVVLYIWGHCQLAECQQIHGSESSGESLVENIRRAKDMEVKGGYLYIHLCPECSFKIFGTLGFGEARCHQSA